jgi:PadR family transcriptional regulator PadR
MQEKGAISGRLFEPSKAGGKILKLSYQEVKITDRGLIMKDTVQLTQLELVLLQFVERGKGKWSWYELANALSRRDVPREPDMMTVLKNLAQQGLVKRYVEKESPRDRWELTSKGEVLLK